MRESEFGFLLWNKETKFFYSMNLLNGLFIHLNERKKRDIEEDGEIKEKMNENHFKKINCHPHLFSPN